MSNNGNGLSKLLFTIVALLPLSVWANSQEDHTDTLSLADQSEDPYDWKSLQYEQISLPIALHEGKAFVINNKLTTEISPHLISFDLNGNVIVFDLEGHILSPDGKLPFIPESPIKEIQRIDDVKIITAVGSHYQLILTSRGYYAIPLPH
jgi:hypothetical protein